MQSAERLAARSELYNFLSRAYYSPEVGLLKKVCSSAVHDAFSALELPHLARELEAMAAYLHASTRPLELSVEYTRLFRGPVKAEVYPYESMHIDGEIMGESALDVVRRYREVGIEVSAEFKDLPDHICAEMEFMRYLCIRELELLEAGDTEKAACIHLMGRSFIKEHLVKWLPRFADRVLQYATMPFYLSLARITREFIDREAANNAFCLDNNKISSFRGKLNSTH